MHKPSVYLAETNTDKLHSHNYGQFYDMCYFYLLGHGIAHEDIRILEIGVSLFGVGSGHAFSKMVGDRFVGVDKDALQSPLPNDGNFLQVENAYSAETLKLLESYEPFHLIIDDGSHLPSHQIYFFRNYERFCASTSIMVCEDVQYCYWITEKFHDLRSENLQFFNSDTLRYGGDHNILMKIND